MERKETFKLNKLAKEFIFKNQGIEEDVTPEREAMSDYDFLTYVLEHRGTNPNPKTK